MADDLLRTELLRKEFGEGFFNTVLLENSASVSIHWKLPVRPQRSLSALSPSKSASISAIRSGSSIPGAVIGVWM